MLRSPMKPFVFITLSVYTNVFNVISPTTAIGILQQLSIGASCMHKMGEHNIVQDLHWYLSGGLFGKGLWCLLDHLNHMILSHKIQQ